MKSVLITGANRGLGLGMVKYVTQHNKAQTIFATCRKESEVRMTKFLIKLTYRCHFSISTLNCGNK